MNNLCDNISWEKYGFYFVLLLAAASCISTGIMSVGIVLCALVVVLQRIFSHRWIDMDKHVAVVMGLYFLLTLVIALLSLDPLWSLRVVASEVYRVFPFFFAVAYVKTQKQFRQVLFVFALSVLVNESVAASQFVRGFYSSNGWIDVKGLNGSHTFLGCQTLLSLPVLLLGLTRQDVRRTIRGFFAFVIALLGVMLVFSQARGAWVGFVGTIILWAIVDVRWRKRCAAILGGAALLFTLLAVLYTPLGARLVSSTDPNFAPNAERFLMWQSAIAIWKDYPVHGIGQDMFGLMYNTKYISPLAKERGDDPSDPRSGHGHPHNNFFKVLSEGGVIGIFASLMLHGYVVFRLWMLHQKQKGTMTLTFGMTGLLILTAIALEGLTDTNMNQHPIIRTYWLLIGTLFAGSRMAARR